MRLGNFPFATVARYMWISIVTVHDQSNILLRWGRKNMKEKELGNGYMNIEKKEKK